jgi:WD40 repeat protein
VARLVHELRQPSDAQQVSRLGDAAMQTDYEYDLFVSYADADRAWVEGYLLDALTQAGVRVHSEAAFALGAPRLLEFERAVQDSRRILLVLSPAYLAEDFTQFTDLLAQSYGLETATWPVIPLTLKLIQLPSRLAMLEGLDATDSETWPAAIERLCAELQRPVPGPPPRPACPYPGMVPFSEADSERFFGRDREVKEALELLRLYPFLAVIGPSGSGKSSLVFAGLIPTLRQSGLFLAKVGPHPAGKRPGSAEDSFQNGFQWSVRSMRPGERPSDALQRALRPERPKPNRPLLLVVDQFEELYTQAREEEVKPFQQTLLRLVETPNCYLVLTVRADFYPDLMASSMWDEIKAHRVEVLPLDEAGLRQAIVGPSQSVGVCAEAELVERLLKDAAGGEPGILPLLQEALVLTWERLERRFLPLSAYEDLGSKERTGLQAAIARRADAALAGLKKPGQEEMARRIFLRLIQFGEGRADTRRQQPVSALRAVGDDPRLFDKTLHHLADSRLLTLSGEEEDPDRQADLAHEALIEGWPTLQVWLAERREVEQTRRRLEAAAVNWEQLQQRGGLLDEVELLEAERWLASPDAAELGYSKTLPQLVVASRAAIEEAEREREDARQRELQLERQRAEEAEARRRAEEERAREAEAREQEQAGATRRFRRLAAILAVIFLLALGAAGYAVIQQQRAQAESDRAEQQARIALSRQLAVQSGSELDKANYELALLVAIEAGRAVDTAEALSALRQTFVHRGQTLTILRHEDWVHQATWNADETRILTASSDGTARVWDAESGGELTILRHQDTVRQATWNADESRILTASSDGTARVWDAQSGQELVILRHEGRFTQASWNSDETRILTVGCDRANERGLCEDGTVRVWDAETGAELATLHHESGVSQATWNADGTHILTASGDGTARVWDAQSGGELTILRHESGVSQATWNADETRILTAGYDSTARVWDADSKRELTILRHEVGLWQATWNADETRILTTSRDGAARVWDAQSGEELVTLASHEDMAIYATWNADETRILTASDDGTARVWDAQGRGELAILRHEGTVNQATWNADETRILTASGDGTARVWDAQGRGELAILRHEDWVNQATWNADETRILTASDDGTARVWDAQSGGELATLHHEGTVRQATWNADGTHILTASGDGTARVWDAESRGELTTLRHEHSVRRATWNADETRILTAGCDRFDEVGRCTHGMARVWDAESGKDAVTLAGHRAGVNQATWNADETRILTASDDGTARVWDAQSGEELTALNRGAGVNQATWNADETCILTASYDSTARVWDVKSGGELTILRHEDWVHQATWNADETRILTASGSPFGDGTAWVWDAESGSELAVLRHEASVNQATWNADETRILTASVDGTARVWDADSGRELATLRHEAEVRQATWNADETRILTASVDGTAKLWYAKPEDLLEAACQRAPRNMTRDEWRRFMGDEEYRATCPNLPIEEAE